MCFALILSAYYLSANPTEFVFWESFFKLNLGLFVLLPSRKCSVITKLNIADLFRFS